MTSQKIQNVLILSLNLSRRLDKLTGGEKLFRLMLAVYRIVKASYDINFKTHLYLKYLEKRFKKCC